MWRYLDKCFSDYGGHCIFRVVGSIGETHFIQGHKLLCGVGLIFSQGGELDIFGRSSFVSKRRLQCIQIVRSYSHELSSPTDILVKLVLQIDERDIRSWGEFYIAQDSASKERPDSLDLHEM